MNNLIKPISLDEWFKEQEKQTKKDKGDLEMVKVRVFDVEDGNFLMEYTTNVKPSKYESMFIEDAQVRIIDIHHILTPVGYEDDMVVYGLEALEVEVEVML